MSPRPARAKFAPVEEFYGMAGIYNADPDVGLAYGAYSDQMQPAKLYEATLEISYSIQAFPGLSLRPGRQPIDPQRTRPRSECRGEFLNRSTQGR